jgi:hypothetical protein
MPVLKRFSPRSVATQALMWLLAGSVGCVAVGQETAPPEEDPPGRVARLSFTQGTVSLQAVGETTWAPAPLNRPVIAGDYLRTNADGRAEVQVEEAVVRLGGDTNFTFVSMDDRTLRMRMTAGIANLRVRELGEHDLIEVETPQAVTSILRPGNYRLEVNGAGGVTVLKVSSGMLEARGGGESLVVRAQQTATLTGIGRFAYTTGTLGAPDSFDEWSLERDLRIQEARSAESSRYVSDDVVGYEDLDSYGEWRSEPEYGYVWSPRVVAGWSPYRFGRYSYVSGWGWAWIADEPWGFAPFHYGSWVTIGGRWCWVPGPRHTRVYRPGYGDHVWHVPNPPRRGTTRDWDRDRNGSWDRNRDGIPSSASGLRTIPDGSYRQPDGSYRGVRGGGRRMEMPESGTGVTSPPPVGSGPVTVPPVTVPPAGDRWMRVPRNETPNGNRENTFPRNDSRVDWGNRREQGSTSSSPRQPRMEMPRRENPRPESSRPNPPAAQAPAPRAEPSRPAPSAGRDHVGNRGTRGGLQPR